MAKWEFLVAARGRLHLSQLEAAERVNVGLVTYQRWEAGKAKPQPQHMRHLYEVFGVQLDHVHRGPLQDLSVHETLSNTSLSPSTLRDSAEEMPIVTSEKEIDEAQSFIAANMTTHLWSLAFLDHATSDDKRGSIRQAIKECDSMNTDNKNYQITRREALCSLATLPMITLGLAAPGKLIQPAQYGNALAQCAASVEACWELYQSGNASDTSLAFKSASTYLSVLQTISKNSSYHQKEALDLATRYALLKTLLGWICVGPAETIPYAKNAVALSKETDNISLQLSAYSKLAWGYFYEKKYPLALTTAREAETLLQRYLQLPKAQPLHPSVQGGTYSTLALMLAKNGQSPYIALGKASEMNPDESYAFMTMKRSTLLLEAGWTYCYYGNQGKAMETLEQRVHPETLVPKISQSAMGRVETINIMALSSLKRKDRDIEQTIHFWVAGMEGAKLLQNQQRFNEALATYELMEVVWPEETRIKDLRDHIIHWE